MESMDLEELNHLLVSEPAVLLYFYNDYCMPCKALRPKVAGLLKEDYPRIHAEYLSATGNPEITAHLGVFSAPTLLVYFEGKEVFRGSAYTSMEELKQKIDRYYTLYFDQDWEG